jgi:hypothetical protein
MFLDRFEVRKSLLRFWFVDFDVVLVLAFVLLLISVVASFWFIIGVPLVVFVD